MKFSSEIHSGDVNIDSGLAEKVIHFSPESIFTWPRNPYSHPPESLFTCPGIRNPACSGLLPAQTPSSLSDAATSTDASKATGSPAARH